MIRLSECVAPAFGRVHRDVCARGHREYWLRGGRGSGKSSFVSIEIILELLKNPDANAIVYRKVAATLRESVYEQMIWAVEKLGLARYFRFRLAPLELEYLPTRQRVLFRGADDPGKSKSIKLSRGYFAILWMEELDEFFGMEDVRTIKASVLRGGDGILFATYNPPRSARSWVNVEALIPRPDRLVHASTYLDVPENWLGEAFCEEARMLSRTNERAYRHMYLGEAVGTGGQVFDNLILRPLTDDEFNWDRWRCGLDFGFGADPDAFVRAAADPARRRVWIAEEFRGRRTTVDDLAPEVLRRSQGGVVRCDSADPRMIAQLRQRGVNAVAVKKGPGSVNAGMRWLQERSQIIIDPERCPCAAREFAAYEYGRDRSGELLSEYPDRNNHFIDALRYALEPYLNENRARTWEGLY